MWLWSVIYIEGTKEKSTSTKRPAGICSAGIFSSKQWFVWSPCHQITWLHYTVTFLPRSSRFLLKLFEREMAPCTALSCCLLNSLQELKCHLLLALTLPMSLWKNLEMRSYNFVQCFRLFKAFVLAIHIKKHSSIDITLASTEASAVHIYMQVRVRHLYTAHLSSVWQLDTHFPLVFGKLTLTSSKLVFQEF